jgi:hypothetical protein
MFISQGGTYCEKNKPDLTLSFTSHVLFCFLSFFYMLLLFETHYVV